MTRREWIAVTAAGALAARSGVAEAQQSRSPRLDVTLHAPSKTIAAGRHAMNLRRERDGLVYVPASVRRGSPAPVLLLLHGATGSAQGIGSRFPMAEETGVVLVVPSSAGHTWDGIQGRYGEDVRFIESALEFAIDRIDADPKRFAVGGFSDGASYALALGLANGDLFTHVLAFSPGFIPPAQEHGRKPAVFISHGTRDTILPIESTSRRIVPRLRRAGNALEYHEFDGPHTVLPALARQAFDWFTASPGGAAAMAATNRATLPSR